MQQSIVLLASLAAAFSIIGTSAQAQNQAEIAAQQLQRQQQREKAQSDKAEESWERLTSKILFSIFGKI
ncbi:hypothetical protein GTP56_15625 [Duganella sp. FT134W]|uniref:Uncharacterized protein n=1 Tax=Duganella margarita TaxID=2692170 RepID=A0A7X4H2P6_9BURK|nr:hypothetical protein [Duganella margarita]MYM73621.1 hypothetical protein [Duganella margarita]